MKNSIQETEGHILTTTQQHKTKALGRTTLFTGTIAAIGCMVACSLPVLAAGGALAGLGALLAGWWPAAVVVLATLAGITAIYLRRRKVVANSTGCALRRRLLT